MTVFFHLALLGWPFVCIYAFKTLPARRALIVSVLGGFLFLPQGGYPLPGFPDYTRYTAISLGALLGATVRHGNPFKGLRLQWFDLPVLTLCVSPFFSSVTNGLGAYDGASIFLTQLIYYGIPYLLGRTWLSDLEGVKDLTIATAVAGLIYLPLALFEIRMSPILHYRIYGFKLRGVHSSSGIFGLPHSRFVIFLSMPINCGAFIAATALSILWLAMCRETARLRNVSVLFWRVRKVNFRWFAGPMIILTIATKVMTGIFLLAFGAGMLVYTKLRRSKLPFYVAIALIGLYFGARTVGGWTGGELVDFVGNFTDTFSLQARLNNEALVVERAMEKPLLGYGPWAGYRTREVEALDGLWIITLGKFGFIGLLSLFLTHLLPVLSYLWSIPRRRLLSPEFAPAIGLCVVLVGFMIHNIFNAMVVPFFTLAAGALAGAALATRREQARRALAERMSATPRLVEVSS